jgi:hypothetical protein
MAELRKTQKEQKEKAAAEALQQTKQRPVFARPSTITTITITTTITTTTTWSQLTKAPAFTPPPTPPPPPKPLSPTAPPAKPSKTSRFVWKASDFEIESHTAKSAKSAEDPVDRFVWKASDADHTTTTESAPKAAIVAVPPVESEQKAELPEANRSVCQCGSQKLAEKSASKPEDERPGLEWQQSPISTVENELKVRPVILQIELQQSWESPMSDPSMTIHPGVWNRYPEGFYPVLTRGYWAFDPRLRMHVFVTY